MIYQNSNPIQNSLEQYIPLPLEELYKAGAALQARGDKMQEINDQFQSGLASLEALAPGQKSYIQNYVSKFRDDQNKLLDRFNGNTADIEYGRESKRLISKYASDPNLKIIQETNALYKQKQQLANQLLASGKRYIDTNPTFTGIDQNGNLTSAVGSVRTTDFDDSITKQFQTIGDQVEQIGNVKTSERNIKKRQAQMLSALQGRGFDQDIQDGIDYYKQQGMTDTQARQAIAQLVQSGNSYIKSDIEKDHFYEQLAWEKQKFYAQQAAASAGPGSAFLQQTFSSPIVSGETVINPMRRQVESMIKNLDNKGNLPANTRIIEDTPENRKAFAGRFKKLNDYDTENLGIASGLYPTSKLQVSDFNANEVNMLNYARKIMGIKGGTAKAVLSRFNDVMKSFDNSASDIRITDNTDLNKALADNAARQARAGQLYMKDGNKIKLIDLTKNPDIAKKINKISQKDIQGISSKNLAVEDKILNGYTQFVDESGTKYYTPLSNEYQQRFLGSKLAENYLMNFDPTSNEEATIGNQKIFIDPKLQPIPYTIGGVQGLLVPYKSYKNGKIVGGGALQHLDKNGKPQVSLIDLSTLERNEFQSIGNDLANHNKITGNE